MKNMENVYSQAAASYCDVFIIRLRARSGIKCI